MTPLNKSPFSLDFKVLMILGAWVIDTKSETTLRLYAVHKVIMTTIAFAAIFTLSVDLYLVLGDFKELTWNLCITTLFAGSVTKNFMVFSRSDVLTKLRRKLHKDSESRTSPEDIEIQKEALKELKILQMCGYGITSLILLIWLIARYVSRLWGARVLPIPMRIPFDVDLDDDFQYNLVFIVLGGSGVLGVTLVVVTEMGMFTLYIQLSREYKILMKDIGKLNEIYKGEEEDDSKLQEFNPWLRKIKVKTLIKKISTRQQELIQYTEDFDFCYNKVMLLQFFVASVIIIVSAMQCILDSVEFSGNVSYQLGYMFMVTSDLFFVCLFSTRLYGQCIKVGEIAYSTYWYKFSPDLQKDIGLIIMRSQRPPLMTVGKVMVLDLHAFMHTLRNIYSWLALFRQLEFAKENE